MNMFLKLFKGPIKAMLLTEMTSQKQQVIKIVNEKIDLPKLTEDEEVKLLTSICDAVEEAILIIIDKSL